MNPTDQIINLSGDVFDFLLNQVVTSDIIKEIPVASELIKIRDAWIGIKDRILLNKIYAFVSATNSIDAKEKEKFIQKIREEKDKQKIGEALIICLDAADSIRKAEIMGSVFKSYLSDEITNKELLKAYYSINRCFLSDLKLLSKYTSMTTERQDVGWRLLSAGLVGHQGIDGGSVDSDSGGVIFQINEVGKLLIKHLEKDEKAN